MGYRAAHRRRRPDDGGGEQRDNPFEQDHATSVMEQGAT
jgi:hypothetical protein